MFLLLNYYGMEVGAQTESLTPYTLWTIYLYSKTLLLIRLIKVISFAQLASMQMFHQREVFG